MVNVSAFKLGFYGGAIQKKLEAKSPQMATADSAGVPVVRTRGVTLTEPAGGGQEIGKLIDVVATQMGLSGFMRILGIVARIATTILSLGIIPLLLGQKDLKDIGGGIVDFYKDIKTMLTADTTETAETAEPTTETDLKAEKRKATSNLYAALTTIEENFSNGVQDKWPIIHAFRKACQDGKEFPDDGLNTLEDLNKFLGTQVKFASEVSAEEGNRAIEGVDDAIRLYVKNHKVQES